MKIVTSRDFEDHDDEPLFAKPKGGSGTFVFRHGRLVPKWQVNNPDDIDDKRSDLAAPMVMRDIADYRNVVDGKMITSRSWHREFLKKYDLVEVGNEYMPQKKPTVPKGEIARDIKETIEQLNAGYVNPDEGVMPADYVEEKVEELDDIEVTDEQVFSGEYIRQENTKD